MKQSRRRFWSWLLGTAGLIVLLATLVVGMRVHRYSKTQAIVESMGGALNRARAPTWLRNVVGDRFTESFFKEFGLSLPDAHIDDDLFSSLMPHLSQTGSFNYVWLRDTSITDKSIKQLLTLGDLESVNLTGTDISDAALKMIAESETITFLDLSDTKITDDGLSKLTVMSQLRWLHLDHTAVTNDGMTQLKVLSNLEYLSVVNTDVDEEGTRVLQAAIPKLEISDD